MDVKVSAVIPTRNRCDLLLRAVQSVLNQSFAELEVIVVIDGQDELTEQKLRHFQDSRLRVIALTENVGGCEARNIGARCARGKYVALLDDDDEWLPEKITKQYESAEKQDGQFVFVTSQFIERDGEHDLVRPRKFVQPGQHISEFLWCEVSLLGGIEGFPQTSTWFLSRSLLMEVPFTVGLRALQDLDWLLHAFSKCNIRTRWIQEPLAIFHNESNRARVAKKISWKFSYDWALQNRSLFSPKGFSFFVVIYCLNPAAREGTDLRVLLSLLSDCRTYGVLTPRLVWLSILYGVIYPHARRLTSANFQRRVQYRLTSWLGMLKR